MKPRSSLRKLGLYVKVPAQVLRNKFRDMNRPLKGWKGTPTGSARVLFPKVLRAIKLGFTATKKKVHNIRVMRALLKKKKQTHQRAGSITKFILPSEGSVSRILPPKIKKKFVLPEVHLNKPLYTSPAEAEEFYDNAISHFGDMPTPSFSMFRDDPARLMQIEVSLVYKNAKKVNDHFGGINIIDPATLKDAIIRDIVSLNAEKLSNELKSKATFADYAARTLNLLEKKYGGSDPETQKEILAKVSALRGDFRENFAVFLDEFRILEEKYKLRPR